MNYYEDVYKKRVSFRGGTKKNIITDMATIQFQENLAESPNTEQIELNREPTEGIIITNKADQSKLSMHLYTAKDNDVYPGTIVKWGAEEWLIMSSDKYSAPAYNKSLMFRSNVRVKFYDGYATEDVAPIE